MVKRYHATQGPNFMRCTNLEIIVHVIKLHQEKENSWAMQGLDYVLKKVHGPCWGLFQKWKSSWMITVIRFKSIKCSFGILLWLEFKKQGLRMIHWIRSDKIWTKCISLCTALLTEHTIFANKEVRYQQIKDIKDIG